MSKYKINKMEHKKVVETCEFCINLRKYEIYKRFQFYMYDTAFFEMGLISCFHHLFHVFFYFKHKNLDLMQKIHYFPSTLSDC